MIFVDTGAWYASIVPDDDNHQAARQWLDGNTEALLTTDYIIDETLTLLKMRGHPALALQIGAQLFAGELADIIQITENDVIQAWQIFHKYTDKGWSFTDCCASQRLFRSTIISASLDRLSLCLDLASNKRMYEIKTCNRLSQLAKGGNVCSTLASSSRIGEMQGLSDTPKRRNK